MDIRHIVALEIGSSKIKGLVASIGELGDISVIAIEETRVNNCVRYGKIQNVQEVSARVNEIIRKLENNPRISPRKVTDVFVSIGGRTLSTVTAQAQAKFPNAIEITAETIERLKREASFGLVTDKTMLEMVPRTFIVDNSEVKNVVGTIGSHLRAVFSAIVISAVNKRNLELIKFDTAERHITRHYVLRPIAQADLVLSSSEMQLGCSLVDLGAETTTISIYKDDVLQHIVTLPIGSRNITRDLMSGMSMTEDRAEMAKADEGSATSEAGNADIQDASRAEINNYIQARAGEIVANIMHQIDVAGFKPQDLPGGIVLIGGGAKLRNFTRLVEIQSKMPVRRGTIEGSLRLKGIDDHRYDNIDVLSTVKYAAVTSSIDCLETLQTQPEESEHSDQTSQNGHDSTAAINRDTTPRQPGRRHVDDDDSLLEDDSDDVATIDRPSIKGKAKRPEKRDRQPADRDEDNFDDELDNEDDETSGNRLSSVISNFKVKLGAFWTRQIDEEDDLDEPTK